MKRGDVYLCRLHDSLGSEQDGERPVLVIQNNIGNKFSPTIIVASITSKFSKSKIPTHVEIPARFGGLEKDSVVLLEQLRTIDKNRIINSYKPFARLDEQTMKRIDEALMISLGLCI